MNVPGDYQDARHVAFLSGKKFEEGGGLEYN